MKGVIYFLIILCLAFMMGLSLHQHPGVMVIAIAGWRVDLPLWLGVLTGFMFYLIVLYSARFILGIFKIPNIISTFSLHFKKQRAKKLTNQGFILLGEQKFFDAERLLIKGAKSNDLAWLNYINAAKAAQAQGEVARRDNYLRHAIATKPEASISIGLMQAKWQCQQKQYEQSLHTLLLLDKKAPSHSGILNQLKEVYFELQQWEKLIALVPRLKRYDVLSKSKLQTLEKKLWQEILKQHKDNLETIKTLWQKIPIHWRKDKDIALQYALILHSYSQSIPAEKVLKDAIKREWQKDLVRLYGRISHPEPQKMLAAAQQWLITHPQDPILLLTLGRLCEQLELWGKAQRYYEASIRLMPLPESYAQLATLLEKMNKADLGAMYYKKGLLLASLEEALV